MVIRRKKYLVVELYGDMDDSSLLIAVIQENLRLQLKIYMDECAI